MAKKKRKESKPDTRHFVQIEHTDNVGVEVTTGQAWVGIDQQVGHGSADALFALTDEEYVNHLTFESNGGLVSDCWKGKHPERLLHYPGSLRPPENWSPSRTRRVRPRFTGELWRHLDALGTAPEDPALAISRAVSGGTAVYETVARDDGVEVVHSMTLPLTGENAYPRPGALVTGLDGLPGAGSSVEEVRHAFGDPIDGDPSTDAQPDDDTDDAGAGRDDPTAASGTVLEFAIEGDRVKAEFDEDGLAALVLIRPPGAPFPSGFMRTLLAALGTPEYGPEFMAAVRLLDSDWTRKMIYPGRPRRVLAFDSGAEIQTEGGRVISVRVGLDQLPHEEDFPRTREELRERLGTPRNTSGGVDLYRFGECEVYLEDARTVTMVPCGVSVSHEMSLGYAGDYCLFLDVLGSRTTDPIVQHTQGLHGVELGYSKDRVSSVTIGKTGYASERFAAFDRKMPGDPLVKDLPFRISPTLGDTHDHMWFEYSLWYHVGDRDGDYVDFISIGLEPPHGYDRSIRRFAARK